MLHVGLTPQIYGMLQTEQNFMCASPELFNDSSDAMSVL